VRTIVFILYIKTKGIIMTNPIYTSVFYLNKEGKNE
jgi:hypothetical protein